jgi:hypothetical protein
MGNSNTKKGTREMIETLVKPQPLDNDVAVVKIIQLLGQLSLNDIQYILRIIAKVYGKVYENDVESTTSTNV